MFPFSLGRRSVQDARESIESMREDLERMRKDLGVGAGFSSRPGFVGDYGLPRFESYSTETTVKVPEGVSAEVSCSPGHAKATVNRADTSKQEEPGVKNDVSVAPSADTDIQGKDADTPSIHETGKQTQVSVQVSSGETVITLKNGTHEDTSPVRKVRVANCVLDIDSLGNVVRIVLE